MKKSRNSDKLFPLYKHPTDALPAPNGADFGVWGYCPQQAFFASVLTLALLAGLFSPTSMSHLLILTATFIPDTQLLEI